ncbi:hypothetical protein JCM3770_002822 [Rhodotorula araucariae]
MAATKDLWADSPIYKAVSNFDEPGNAYRAFMHERRNFRSRNPSQRSRDNRDAISDTDTDSDSDSRNSFENESGQGVSDSDSEAEDQSYGSRSARRAKATRGSKTQSNLPCPGLPGSGDYFDSRDEFYAALVKAVVPVYGSSVKFSYSSETRAQFRCSRYGPPTRCSFVVFVTRDKKTKRWSLDPAASNTVHLHKPDDRILADPSWRPAVVNSIARTALGLDEAAVRSSTPENSPESSRKHPRSDLNTVDHHRADEPSPASPAKKPRVPVAGPSSVSAAGVRSTLMTSAASVVEQHPFHASLASYLTELDESKSLVVLTPYLLAGGITSFKTLFALRDDAKKVSTLCARINQQISDTETVEALFHFVSLVGR